MKKPLIVTDPGLASLPMLQAAKESCSVAGLDADIFSEIQGNPVKDNVDAGVAYYKDGGFDGIVAFGGGSALDAAKAVALMVGQSHDLWTYVDDEHWDGSKVDVAGMAPVVAVPTTSGTGSEVGRASVITDERDHTKKIIFHPRMLPERVILDPAVTSGLPPHITAAVGMDALSHCMEAFSSPLYHPMAHGIGLEGMKLIKDWLPRAFHDGSDIEARAHLQVASTMGATAFQKGLGAMHSLAHPCGAVLNTHHGLTNAVVMPYVMIYNKAAIEDQFAELARYLDLEKHSFEGVLDWVLQIREELKIPHTLKDIGVEESHIAQLAPMAVVDPSTGTNPVPLTEASSTQLFKNCINGNL